MTLNLHRGILSAVLGAGLFAALAAPARAQDIEPRAYSNAPVGVNFLIVGYAGTRGGLSLDPALPLTDPELKTSNALLAYARVLDLWGKSAKFDAIVPYVWLSGNALLDGEPVERIVDGFADSRFRLSVNLLGAPALPLAEFRKYRQNLIFGASLQVMTPTGQYDETRLVNIGTNRWTFKPELGLSKSWAPLTVELMTGALLYTENTSFYNGNTRAQEPIWSIQAHGVYSFRAGLWASAGATWLTGGTTTINGVRKDDRQKNWRLGGTLAYPLDPKNSLKLQVSSGVSSRTGNDFDFIALGWQHRWGGGI